MRVYYNDNDGYVCAWLEGLMDAGVIPAGDVDDRDIEDIRPSDLRGYEQCHFFAGIGGWAYAPRLARFNGPLWTGSCPCQPFSVAGKRQGEQDERHLWPAFRWLIAQCRPPLVLGEQVASLDALRWIAGVYADLEALGYRVPLDDEGNWEAYDLPAACVGAPHIRQRLWWVADAVPTGRAEGRAESGSGQATGYGSDSRLANSNRVRRSTERQAGGLHELCRGRSNVGVPTKGAGSQRSRLGNAERDGGRGDEPERRQEGRVAAGWAGERCGSGLDNAAESRQPSEKSDQSGEPESWERLSDVGCPWDNYILVPCRDGKARRIEPGTAPLAHGIPQGVGKLRAYGNAIVPQVAAKFVKAYLEAER